MEKRAEEPYDNTSPNTVSMIMRYFLTLYPNAATLWVTPFLLLLDTLIAILKCMYKRKKYESSKNKGHSKALKYIPYWTRIHVTNSLFLPWFSGSFTIEIFNQRDVASIKTDTFHSQTFHDAYEKKRRRRRPFKLRRQTFIEGTAGIFHFPRIYEYMT